MTLETRSILLLGYFNSTIITHLDRDQIVAALQSDINTGRTLIGWALFPRWNRKGFPFVGTLSADGFHANYVPTALRNKYLLLHGRFTPAADGMEISIRSGNIIGGIARILVVLAAWILALSNMRTGIYALIMGFIVSFGIVAFAMFRQRRIYEEAVEMLAGSITRVENSSLERTAAGGDSVSPNHRLL